VADLDGDGNPDVVVANSDTAHVTTGALNVFIGKGDGTFRTATTYDFGRGAASVAVADLNGDGKVDLAVSTFDRTLFRDRQQSVFFSETVTARSAHRMHS
jgi:hypothetical protein